MYIGWRIELYGPVVTSSGLAFSVIGIPQLRPRYALAQTASASPSTTRVRPMPCSNRSLTTVWRPLKNFSRTKITIMTMIATRAPANRRHLMRPDFTPMEAASQ